MKYTGQYTKEISFPLGGIGTGCIGLGGDGRLIDWEIFNRPSKGSVNGYSHFAIRAIEDERITAAVLNGDMQKELIGQLNKHKWSWNCYGFGANTEKMCGFPHFKDLEFDGEFPIATLDFQDERFPGNVRMTAFNPFIPLDSENSSLPAAFFEIEVENTTTQPIQYQIALTLSNPYETSRNEAKNTQGMRSITFYPGDLEKDTIGYGDLTIATDCEVSYTQTYWYRGGWKDDVVRFWSDFSTSKEIMERIYDTDGNEDKGTLIAEISVPPSEKKKARFLLSWNVPIQYNYWNEYKNEDGSHKTWKNYYATVFDDSLQTARYALSHWEDLYSRTLAFKNALHGSTLPKEVIDAASANLSVLKSPTVLRLEDGSFYGWEGVAENIGLCEGTCQHVWTYAYAMCFLFPDLERSIRESEFKYSTEENGRMQFRMNLPVEREKFPDLACVDGQMGAVIKCYREWKISGDGKWLADQWERIQLVLEYAWSEKNADCWDLDKDGVMEGRQHNTLDGEMFGPSSWLQSMYLAALKAASEMAEFLGDAPKAKEYAELFERGYAWTKENLFNGEYFIQKINITDKGLTDRFGVSNHYWDDEAGQIKYQIADGCLLDQMLGQWHADLIGLGEMLDAEQVDRALDAVMKYNFKPSMRYFVNPWRGFALNDEAGTVICHYPDGAKKAKIPLSYGDETMTGFEYAFAGLLCSRGKIDDGLKVVRAVRDRFDGEKRNPWNEFECGNNYARSMASYALIPILSGFEFDMPRGHIGFDPYQKEDFCCVWSLADAWGVFELDKTSARLKVYEGALTLQTMGVKFLEKISQVKIDGVPIDFHRENGNLCFDRVTVHHSVELS